MAYSTISKPGLHFNTKLYSGTGSSQNITGVGFQPDWTWVKSRTNAEAHVLRDAVRGNYRLNTASSGAQDDATSSISGFVSDGFTVATADAVNNSSQTYVAWNWKANGAGSANTDGDINSTVSVNTTAGFSIVKWTGNGTAGATVGHGLGSEMKFMILKDYGLSRTWITYHHSLGNQSGINLNENGAGGTNNNAYWNSTSPTSSVFSTGTYSNENNSNYICYCFAEKKGYSKFGSYTGNASTNGPFIYTGFKPAWVLQKNYTNGSSNDWTLADNKRPGYNEINKRIVPNDSAAEATNNQIDFVSNGFKIRGSESNANGNNNTYIYMAFAENPLVVNVGQSIPATAG